MIEINIKINNTFYFDCFKSQNVYNNEDCN